MIDHSEELPLSHECRQRRASKHVDEDEIQHWSNTYHEYHGDGLQTMKQNPNRVTNNQ